MRTKSTTWRIHRVAPYHLRLRRWPDSLSRAEQVGLWAAHPGRDNNSTQVWYQTSGVSCAVGTGTVGKAVP
jgi:hypothetical protein